MKFLFMFCCFVSSYYLSNADARIDGVFNLKIAQKISVEVREVLPLSSSVEQLTKKVDLGDNKTFSIALKIKKSGFFQLLIITGEGDNRSQYITTIYLAPQTILKLEFLSGKTGRIHCNFADIRDSNNRSMVMMQEKFNQLMEENFFNPPANEEQAKTYLNHFLQIADSLVKQASLTPRVKKYIRFKGAETYQSSLYQYLYGKDIQISGNYSDLPDNMISYYEDSFMLLFPSSIQNLVNYLNLKIGLRAHASRKSLEQIKHQITLLEDLEVNKKINDLAIERLLNVYTTRYNVAESFEADVKNFDELADYIADEKMATTVKEAFSNLKFTMKGSAIPPVKFTNINGDTVTLDRFLGKYVFIDLWASWCVPCIKMTPYVQQLEEDYKKKNIVFVAISLDKNKEAWLNKMQQMKMEGNQLLDQKSEFSKRLNVSGIPHYLIYDPSGRLLIYKTAMPDSPKLRETLDSLLVK